MLKSYSIAEAKNRLPEIVHQAEHESPIQLTRRGKPVAVLLSQGEYERLQKGKITFGKRIWPFASAISLPNLILTPMSSLQTYATAPHPQSHAGDTKLLTLANCVHTSAQLCLIKKV